VLFINITRLASNEISPPSNKIHREVGRAKDLSAPPVYVLNKDVVLAGCCCEVLQLYKKSIWPFPSRGSVMLTKRFVQKGRVGFTCIHFERITVYKFCRSLCQNVCIEWLH